MNATDTLISPTEAADRVKVTALRLWEEIGVDPLRSMVLSVAKGFDKAMQLVDDNDLREQTIDLAWVIASASYQAKSVTRAMLDLPLQKDVPSAVALQGNTDVAVWRSACLLVSGLKFIRIGQSLGLLEIER